MPPRKISGSCTKAQRPITSFLAFKKPPTKESNAVDLVFCDHDNDKEAGHRALASARDVSGSPDFPTNNAPAAKRPRTYATEEASQVPSPAIKPRVPTDEEQTLLHERFQKKLVGSTCGADTRAAARAAALTPLPNAKLTPLEQQVTELKKANPGVLLVVEVWWRLCPKHSLVVL